MDMKQVVAGAQGAPQGGGMADPDAKMLDMMTQMRVMMDEMIAMMGGEEQGEDRAKQAGFASVDQGMMG